MVHALNDRAWLHQADFTLILDTAVKETFPPELLQQIPISELEGAVLRAHDRAFEEARVTPVLWETVQGNVEGKKAPTKVYNALESGRSAALKAVEAAAGD